MLHMKPMNSVTIKGWPTQVRCCDTLKSHNT